MAKKVFPCAITTREQQDMKVIVEVLPVLIEAENNFEAEGKVKVMAKNLFPHLPEARRHTCIGRPEIVEPDNAKLEKYNAND